MAESENDGFYWEPSAEDVLRQGDLLVNVPTGLMPNRPRFVLGDGEEVRTVTYDDYPDVVPSTDIVVDARFGAFSMIVTPTCHIAEGEKDEDIVAVVPVEPLNLVVPDLRAASAVAERKQVPKQLFVLPPTDLGGAILRYTAVAQLDRPASMLKHNLRDYRCLGLYLEARISLRIALANFWARGNAKESIERSMQAQIKAGRPLEVLE
jgi:hypothetical protein